MLRDLQSKSEQLQASGKGIQEAHAFLRFLLPSMVDGLKAVGLPSEAQLQQMLSASQGHELAAGAAAIIDAIAPIQQDPKFEQVKLHSSLSSFLFSTTDIDIT